MAIGVVLSNLIKLIIILVIILNMVVMLGLEFRNILKVMDFLSAVVDFSLV